MIQRLGASSLSFRAKNEKTPYDLSVRGPYFDKISKNYEIAKRENDKVSKGMINPVTMQGNTNQNNNLDVIA